MSFILLLCATATTIKIPLLYFPRTPQFSCMKTITGEMRNASFKTLSKNILVLQMTTPIFTVNNMRGITSFVQLTFLLCFRRSLYKL